VTGHPSHSHALRSPTLRYKYMHDFKRILDTSAPGDMDMLCEQYPHFYRFAKLMEQLAEGIAAGNFDDVLGKRH